MGAHRKSLLQLLWLPLDRANQGKNGRENCCWLIGRGEKKKGNRALIGKVGHGCYGFLAVLSEE